MNKIVVVIILSFQSLFSQNDIKVVIPKADCFSSEVEIKDMWVGLKNPIVSNYVGADEFIKIWTDNGIVDSGNYYYSHYCIIPSREGKVTVSSILKIRNGKEWDTVSTKDEFMAIEQPKIRTLINDELLKDSLLLDFFFIFDNSKKPVADSEYILYPFNYTIKVFMNDIESGDIEFYTEKDEIKNILRKGNIIHLPSFTLIDIKKSLFIETPEETIKYH